jgi:endogenous inhibitor of DNA gyrase (YacG/DUF329 family)
MDDDYREYPDEDASHYEGYCPTCEKNVETITIDEGIGWYEYGGVRGYHKDIQEVCPECWGQVEDWIKESEDDSSTD